jgi:hypothetical protein
METIENDPDLREKFQKYQGLTATKKSKIIRVLMFWHGKAKGSLLHKIKKKK